MNYSQLPGTETKERFKLYKAGKLWLVAGTAFLSMTGAALMGNVQAHADTTSSNVKTTAVTNSVKSATSQSTPTSASSEGHQKLASLVDIPAVQATSADTAKSTTAKSDSASQANSASQSATSASAKSDTASQVSQSVKSDAATSASSVQTSQSAKSDTTSQVSQSAKSDSTSQTSQSATSASAKSDSASQANSASQSTKSDSTSQASQSSQSAKSDVASQSAKSDTASQASQSVKSDSSSQASQSAKSDIASDAASKAAKPADESSASAKASVTNKVVTPNGDTTKVKNTVKNNVPVKNAPKLIAPMMLRAYNTVDVWKLGDKSRPRVDAIDISSYQGGLSQADFKTMARYGVKTIIIKATQGTDYANPYFLEQVKYANAAGMNVDVYHYATFNSKASSTAEANHLASYLTSENINKKVLVFADMEDSSTYTTSIQSLMNNFWNVLNHYGYTNHGIYTGNSYLYRDAVINTVGKNRTWKAQYPFSPQAGNNWNTDDAAWQFSSTVTLPTGYRGYLDASIDYTGFLSQSAGTHTIGNTSSDVDNKTHVTPTNPDKHPDAPSEVIKSQSGTYQFNATTPIRNKDSDSATQVGTYYKGDKVIYNAIITAGKETWLRYTSSNGQHYVRIDSAATLNPVVKSQRGTYQFSQSTDIRTDSDDTAKKVGTYYKGDKVIYNAVITVGNQTWLRYTSSNGQHYVNVTGKSLTPAKPVATPVVHNETGTYEFTETTSIKTSANNSGKTVGTYYKGNTVKYNARVTVGNQTWLRYTSASGQHYVNVSDAPNHNVVTPKFSNASGVYTFTSTTSIKSSADDYASTVGTYYKGNTVSINGKSTVGGQTWLRYTAAGGTQHYVHVPNGASTQTVKSSIPSSGTYKFTTTTNIRTGASTSSRIVGTYYKGDTVRYFGTVQSGGYTWLKYYSSNGIHYVAVV